MRTPTLSRKPDGTRSRTPVSPWRYSVAAALLACPTVGAWASPTNVGDAFTDRELTALVRSAQLGSWLGVPVSLPQGLCIQSRLHGHWPASDDGPTTERQSEALRSAADACFSTSDPAGQPRQGDRGLVTDGRAQFLVLAARLQVARQALDLCRQQPGDEAGRVACAQRVVGRSLRPEEQRWLLATRTSR